MLFRVQPANLGGQVIQVWQLLIELSEMGTLQAFHQLGWRQARAAVFRPLGSCWALHTRPWPDTWISISEIKTLPWRSRQIISKHSSSSPRGD